MDTAFNIADDARAILKPGAYPPSTYRFSRNEWRDAARQALAGDDTELVYMLEDAR